MPHEIELYVYLKNAGAGRQVIFNKFVSGYVVPRLQIAIL
jgi:hypothetical protein